MTFEIEGLMNDDEIRSEKKFHVVVIMIILN